MFDGKDGRRSPALRRRWRSGWTRRCCWCLTRRPWPEAPRRWSMVSTRWMPECACPAWSPIAWQAPGTTSICATPSPRAAVPRRRISSARRRACAFPERHLGLHLAARGADRGSTRQRLRNGSNRIWISIVCSNWLRGHDTAVPALPSAPDQPASPRIGIARDAAFCFYYQDNLELLRDLRRGTGRLQSDRRSRACRPASMDSISAAVIPNCTPRRFPPMNRCAPRSRDSCERRPGLCRVRRLHVSDAGDCRRGRATRGRWPAYFPTTARMQTAASRSWATSRWKSAAEGWGLARGHEFRYSIIDPMPATVTRMYREPAEGYRVRVVLGSYVHLHFLSCPRFAEQFVQDCAESCAHKIQNEQTHNNSNFVVLYYSAALVSAESGAIAHGHREGSAGPSCFRGDCSRLFRAPARQARHHQRLFGRISLRGSARRRLSASRRRGRLRAVPRRRHSSRRRARRRSATSRSASRACASKLWSPRPARRKLRSRYRKP